MNAAATLPRIAAIGAGRMGRGIAIAFAYAGHDVALIDIRQRTADQTLEVERESLVEIAGSLRMLSALGMFDGSHLDAIMARIRFAGCEQVTAALAEADVLFEGVPKVLEAKRTAFAAVCHHARADAIIASTT